jgi:hypothetical protein
MGLTGDEFRPREKAAEVLAKAGESALPALRAALSRRPSAEARRHIKDLQEKAENAEPTRSSLGGLRAIEVLEHIAMPDARQLLQKLAAGNPDARLTREAKAALERLTGGAGSVHACAAQNR